MLDGEGPCVCFLGLTYELSFVCVDRRRIVVMLERSMVGHCAFLASCLRDGQKQADNAGKTLRSNL